MKTYAKGKSVKIEQAGVLFYDCEREAHIEKYDMKLVGTFSMPKKKGGKSIMTSMNEHVRLMAAQYLEEFDLGFRPTKSDGAEYRKVNADMLHGAVMGILAKAIDSISASGESLFDIDIYMKKNQEKELLNELSGIDKNIKSLSYEIEAAKQVKQKAEAILKKYNIPDEQVLTGFAQTNTQPAQYTTPAQPPQPRQQQKSPQPKPQRREKVFPGGFKFKNID